MGTFLMQRHELMSFLCLVVGLVTVTTAESPVTVDRSPPTEGVVRDGPSHGTDFAYQADSSIVCVNFDGFSDPHSGLGQYQWLLGTTPGSDNILMLNLTKEDVLKRVVCINSSLTHGITYYSTIIATNMAEQPLTTSVTSDGGKTIISVYSIYTLCQGSIPAVEIECPPPPHGLVGMAVRITKLRPLITCRCD